LARPVAPTRTAHALVGLAAPASRRWGACWATSELAVHRARPAGRGGYGASIPDLIEMAGTATFRRHERSALDRIITAHDAAIITTRGIVANPETYALLLRRTHTSGSRRGRKIT